jgi:phospholipid transport system transporter-binding protein
VTSGFESHGGGRYSVSGELGFGTVPAIYEASRGGLDESDALHIDLGNVTDVDSAGLALLIEWIRSARTRGKRLVFLNLPEKLLALARMSEIDSLFESPPAA